MAAAHNNPGFAHRWFGRVLPAFVTVLVVGSPGAAILRATAVARNAARAAQTT
jgi:hypothetical protein